MTSIERRAVRCFVNPECKSGILCHILHPQWDDARNNFTKLNTF